MNRIEAFHALFGKNSDLACQEAVDVLLGDLDVTDDEQDELADVYDEIDSFQAGMADYIDLLEPDDLRIPFLKQFLPTKEVEDKAPEEKVPLKTPIGSDNIDALLGGIVGRVEIPEKKTKKVDAETKAKTRAEAKLVPEISEVAGLKAELLTATTKLATSETEVARLKAEHLAQIRLLDEATTELTETKTKLATSETEVARLKAEHHARIRLLDKATTELTETKTKLATSETEVARLKAEHLTATARLEALSRVTVINTNLTWQIQDLLKTPRFQEDRIKIEQAHSKALSPNPDVHAQGRRELASWHAYMNSYAKGNSGHDKILHGKHLLECIQLLREGTDPNSSGYLTRFVDGRSHL